jgi:hypothetical protein
MKNYFYAVKSKKHFENLKILNYFAHWDKNIGTEG